MGPSGGWCPAIGFPPLIRAVALRSAIDGYDASERNVGWCLQAPGPTSPSRSDSGLWERGSGPVLGYWEPTDCWPCFCFAQQ